MGSKPDSDPLTIWNDTNSAQFLLSCCSSESSVLNNCQVNFVAIYGSTQGRTICNCIDNMLYCIHTKKHALVMQACVQEKNPRDRLTVLYQFAAICPAVTPSNIRPTLSTCNAVGGTHTDFPLRNFNDLHAAYCLCVLVVQRDNCGYHITSDGWQQDTLLSPDR